MIDPAIIASLETFRPPPPPSAPSAIAQSWEQQEISSLQARYARFRADKQMEIAAYAKQLDDLARLVNCADYSEPATADEMLMIDGLISDLERSVEDWPAMIRDAREKAAAALSTASLPAELRALYRRGSAEFAEIDRHHVELVLRHAWIMRAIRSRVAPDAGTGPTFDNPADLDRYLATL